MENPLSYRNRLASDLRSQRRSIEDSEKFGPEHFFISGKEAYDNFMFPKPFNSQRQKLYDVLKTTQKTEKYITELIHHRQKVNNERREKREKEKEKFLKEYHFSSHGGVHNITALNQENATELLENEIKRGAKCLNFHKLQNITPDAVWVLAQFDGEIFFPNRNIDKQFMENIASHRGGLIFTEVKNVDADTLYPLRNHIGSLSFHKLKTLSPEAAETLITNQGYLSLHIEKLPLETAEVLAKRENDIYLSPEESQLLVGDLQKFEYYKR